ncbi:MAG: orotate phosphoribosyltransferase [Flavobacteriia bacterium]|nr:orotate phosphoribosyltransferase [Flavobacteriia bacterium]OJX37110.1 MAG: orotate phosphoribosyltransferase [Flavobacteriia bacterium 40-80]
MIKDDIALKVAEFLLQIKAIKLQPNDPFTWASGIKSPIYCDNRKTLSYPTVRTFIRQCFTQKILDTFGKPDIIAGVATGGIPHGVLVAQDLGVPFVYVRSTAKKHGLGNMIEGDYKENQTVVVIEDLISTGGSSLQAVDALKEAGLNVKGLAAIFTYGFDISVQNFEKANCRFATLTNYEYLLDVAIDKKYISASQVETLKEWKNNPEDWTK